MHQVACFLGTVRKVAEFMKIDTELESARVDTAIQMSSFEFVKAHESQFDEKLSKLARNEAMGLPVNAGLTGGGKIRDGKSGGGRTQLSATLTADLDARWVKQMEPATGFSSYQALRLHRRSSVSGDQ